MRYVIGIEWCIDTIRDVADGFVNGYLEHIVNDITEQSNVWNAVYFADWLNRHLRLCVTDAIIYLIFFDNYALSGDHYTKAYLSLNDALFDHLAQDRAVDHGILLTDDQYEFFNENGSRITEDQITDYSTLIADVVTHYMSDTRIMDIHQMEEIIYEINSTISATTNRVIQLEDQLTIHHPGRLVIIESKGGRNRVASRR